MRPHTKTTKSPYWALKQIEVGAIGVCCAKVGEAEVLVEGGVNDILITSEIVSVSKINRLAALARHASIKVVVDNAENARQISEAVVSAQSEISVLVDVNIRINRCGVEPGEPTTTLAKIVDKLPALHFAGLNGYEGHVFGFGDERIPETLEALEKLQYAVSEVNAAGLPIETVSAGGTSTHDITCKVPEVTEVQAGSYIFMDGDYLSIMDDFAPALSLLATVISRPTSDRAVLDTGMKSVSIDRGLPQVVDLPGAEFVKISEEHGAMTVEGEAQRLRIGDKVSLRPMHGDTTINLHTHYFGVRGGRLDSVIEIAGRGRFR